MAANKKRIKPVPDSAIPLLQKRITILCIICGVVIPFIANYVLSYFMVSLTGNMLYKTEYELLKVFITALTTVSLYSLFGAIVNSIVRFGLQKSKWPIALGAIRTLLFYIFTIELCANDGNVGFFELLKQNVSTVAVDMCIDLLLLAGVVMLTILLRSKFQNEQKTNITIKRFFDFKNPLITIHLWVIVLILAFSLATALTQTISAVTSNSSYEVFALVKPYITIIGKSIVGFVIMWGCAKWLDFQWKCLHSSK